jgi:hypothetical protein
MLSENETAARPDRAPGAALSPDHELARHRESVIRAELERRVELFDELEDAAFGEFGAVDWTVCTVVFFVLPLLIAWWAL